MPASWRLVLVRAYVLGVLGGAVIGEACYWMAMAVNWSDPSAGDFGRAALAAAEGRSVAEEERSVARGAAAPTIRREEQLWSGPIDPDERPVEELPPVKTYRARKRPRWLFLGLAVALAAGAIGFAAIPDGGDNVPPPGSPVSESEVERQYRDVRILGIGGGTVEILNDMAARRLGLTA